LLRKLLLTTALALTVFLGACGGAAKDPAPAAPANPATTAAPAAPANIPTGMKRFVIKPADSKVSYKVKETFLQKGNTLVEAVGVTQVLTGEILFDSAQPQKSQVGEIKIDIKAFKSDSERRDGKIQEQWLESAKYPLATFKPTKIEGLPAAYKDGEEISLQIGGDLTVRTKTTPVTFETKGKIEGNKMSGLATTKVKMSELGVEVPNVLNILTVEDEFQIEFSFVAEAQN